jgi:hypothetical protein
VTVDMDHLHIKRIELVSFSYIIIEDTYIFFFTSRLKSSRCFVFVHFK